MTTPESGLPPLPLSSTAFSPESQASFPESQASFPEQLPLILDSDDKEQLLMGLTLDPSSIKLLVIQHQNHDKGYYCYDNWNTLHQLIFGRNQEVFAHMWRTLKLINFGDDYVPTGLVFDTLVTLFNLERPVLENQSLLRKLFFRFIELNGKVILEDEKSEINYLKILRRLIEEYKVIIQRRLAEEEYTPSSEERPRYERLHHLHDLYVYRRNLQKLKKIDDQMKECSFEPQLFPSDPSIQSRYWRQPIKRSPSIAPQQQLFESSIFRAKPVPSYPNRYPVGYLSHTARIKQTFDQKQLIRNMKPSIKTGSPSQFSIVSRNSLRKQNSFINRKVLFVIEIEVGKRRFMLKVREGMTKEEVASMIQRMAGVGDSEVEEVVEEYYENYFRRINRNIEI